MRRSRQALAGIEAQLDELLTRLRDPGSSIDVAASERLRAATNEAGEALCMLPGFDVVG